jgi:hypothetical protein
MQLSSMRSRSDRAFTIADAMILVAATAFGFILIRETLWDRKTLKAMLDHPRESGDWYSTIIQFSLMAILPLLYAWTPAWMAIRLRRPRPLFRRLVRQPGMVGCFVAMLASAIETVFVSALLVKDPRFVGQTSVVFVGYAQQVGFAVLGGWVTLGLVGLWRSEPGWIDRTGRLLGASWIGATAVSWLRYFLY